MRGDDDAERVGIGEGGAQDLVGLDLLHAQRESCCHGWSLRLVPQKEADGCRPSGQDAVHWSLPPAPSRHGLVCWLQRYQSSPYGPAPSGVVLRPTLSIERVRSST